MMNVLEQKSKNHDGKSKTNIDTKVNTKLHGEYYNFENIKLFR